MEPLPPQMPAFLRAIEKVAQSYNGIARLQRLKRVNLSAIHVQPSRCRDRRIVKWLNSLARRSERANRLYRQPAFGRTDRGLK